MTCDILKVSSSPEGNGSGHWVITQNATSGAIDRAWVDDDGTTNTQQGIIKNVPCLAYGVLTSGVKGQGNTQDFNDIYTNVEWIRIYFGPDANVTKRDRITRIRDKDGNVIWKEEESESSPPTVFAVMGITPIPGPFGRVVEVQVLLKRTEVQ
jgi:hypothetical protein